MKEQMNSMNYSGDFQEVELSQSGRLSHVFSHLVMIPSSRSSLSCDKRLPLDTWNQSGSQANVVGNQYSAFDSLRDNLQKKSTDDVQRNREEAVEAGRTTTIHTSEDRQNQGTIPMLTFATKPLTTRSTIPVEIPQNYIVGQQRRQQISELQFDKFLNPQSFSAWKLRFKTQDTTCSDFPSDAVLWIKEEEMVDSVDDLKSSCSVRGFQMPTFEVLDAKIASALNRIIHNTQFKSKVSLQEQIAQNEDRFLRGRQIAYLSYEYFRVTGATDSVQNYADLFTIVLRNDDTQGFDSQWDGILLSMTKIPSDDILEGLYKLRMRESEKFKTVLEL